MEGVNSPPVAQSTSARSFFSPLLISMIGIVVTSMAIIIYHLFLVKYCLRRHGGGDTSATTTMAAMQPTNAALPPKGVDPKILETIPIYTFSALKHDLDQEECAVCLGELEDDDMVRLLPNCNHAFHVWCIDQWFDAHTSCPLCRSPIENFLQTNLEPHSLLDSQISDYSDREIGGEASELPSPRAQPFGLLRHCASLVLPPSVERIPSWWSSSRLKRSWSMDPSLGVIDLQRVNCSSGPSSSSSSSSSMRSLSHFDHVSSKWLRSFSRLRVGKWSSNGTTILPY